MTKKLANGASRRSILKGLLGGAGAVAAAGIPRIHVGAQDACTPDCTDNACGDDGCGGLCPPVGDCCSDLDCAAGSYCEGGFCVAADVGPSADDDDDDDDCLGEVQCPGVNANCCAAIEQCAGNGDCCATDREPCAGGCCGPCETCSGDVCVPRTGGDVCFDPLNSYAAGVCCEGTCDSSGTVICSAGMAIAVRPNPSALATEIAARLTGSFATSAAAARARSVATVFAKPTRLLTTQRVSIQPTVSPQASAATGPATRQVFRPATIAMGPTNVVQARSAVTISALPAIAAPVRIASSIRAEVVWTTTASIPAPSI